MTITRPPITLEELAQQMTELKKTAQENGQRLFKNALLEYFESHPVVNEISFYGYAPYFNDGEPCEFSCDTYSLRVNGEGEDNYDSVDTISPTLGWGDNEHPNPDYNPDMDTAFQDMCKIMNMVPQDTYQDMFGSSFTVIVRRDGTMEVDEAPDHE